MFIPRTGAMIATGSRAPSHQSTRPSASKQWQLSCIPTFTHTTLSPDLTSPSQQPAASTMSTVTKDMLASLLRQQQVQAQNAVLEQRCCDLAAAVTDLSPEAQFPVIRYQQKVVVYDTLHSTTDMLINEVWLPAPYSLAVNLGPKSITSKFRWFAFRCKRPQLDDYPSSAGTPEIVYVARAWCDTIKQYYQVTKQFLQAVKRARCPS